MGTVPQYRESTLELLRDIAALSARVGPVELVCGWFDDLYVPAESSQHPESEAWSRHLQAWQKCFSEAELMALRSFNEVFESVEKDLPTDPATFSVDPRWRRVSEAAAVALGAFSAHVA